MSGDRLLAQGRWAEAARAFERERRVDDAVRAYRQAGEWGEAGRVLFGEQRYREAAAVLLEGVPDGVRRGERPGEDVVRLLRSAAVAFHRAGDAVASASLYARLGERDRAADVLRRAGRNAEAVRVLQGQALAGDPLLQSGPARAASVPRASVPRASVPGASVPRGPSRTPRPGLIPPTTVEGALALLMTRASHEPGYADAARRAVGLAWSNDVLGFELDQWLAPWVRGGMLLPHGTADLRPLFQLATLYQRKDMPEAAEKALEAVLRLDPGLVEAQELLAELRAQRHGGGAEELARILEEDRSFHGGPERRERGEFAPLPSLPSLPDLPSLSQIDLQQTPTRPAAGPADEAEITTRTLTIEPVPEDESPLDPRSIKAGDLIAGRYTVDRLLGRGGMGVVLRVTDTMLEEDVAMKIIAKPDGTDRDVARFKEEMKICRRLVHPSIVRVFEFGAWRGNHFLTMELLDGHDLERMIARAGGPLDPLVVLPLMIQACDGLAAAHKQGVIHRDIKPPNLFVIDEGKTLKVMDFGIAKAGAERDHSLTATGTLVGSPYYIAPERLRGDEDVGPASDLYSLGVVLYQALTGNLPFRGPELPALFNQHLNVIPDTPASRNPRLPESLSEVIMKLLEKRPEDRYPSCRALRRALEEAWGDVLRVS